MTSERKRRVLAIASGARGFGFVCFDPGQILVDWGVKEIRAADKYGVMRVQIRALVALVAPDVLVIEHVTAKGSRRHEHIRVLTRLIARDARTRGITVYRIARRSVHAALDAHTKYAVAEAVARELPVFAPRLPRKRRAWESEDARQSLFDAAALALTYYARDETQ